MIVLTESNDCCGCWSCVTVCPQQCIAMKEDTEGFLYPDIDERICVNCGLCEKVCPVIHQKEERKPLKVYAAKNKDEEIRLNSSSGGVFSLLAEKILNEKGVVFGAKFNENWEVVHAHCESMEGLADFRGSKYVQSRIENTFNEAKEFLNQRRKVLFTGTPCQIAGLKLFLRKEDENLITVDFVCHGVPSPKVWSLYLNSIIAPKRNNGENSILSSLKEKPVITSVSFRDKKKGWKKFGFVVRKSACKADEDTVLLSETLDVNLYMKGFLKDLYLRPSCHACPTKCFKSGSDITIADYWGIQNVLPEFDDDKGVSLVMINNSKGKQYYQNISTESKETSYEDAYQYNPSIEKSVAMNSNRKYFFNKFTKQSLSKTILDSTRMSLAKRAKVGIKAVLRKVLR